MGKKATVHAKAPDARPVTQRGKEWQAVKLTGSRAQRGNLRGGAPCWTYEVVWHGKHKNTWEPASCLIGWEKEIQKIDEQCGLAKLLPIIRPNVEAQKAREAAAEIKAAQLEKRRARLMRIKARNARRAAASGEQAAVDLSDEEDLGEDGDMEEAAVVEQLTMLEQQLAMLTGATAFAAAANAAAAGESAAAQAAALDAEGAAQGARAQQACKTVHRRPGRSRVWKAFNRSTGRCMLPHPADPSRECGALPEAGTGTSGEIRHLQKVHAEEWLHIVTHGERRSQAVIEDALAAQVDKSKPALDDASSNELDRLTARRAPHALAQQGGLPFAPSGAREPVRPAELPSEPLTCAHSGGLQSVGAPRRSPWTKSCASC